jgi:hypothetical protein
MKEGIGPTASPARPTCCWPWTTTSKRSAPMRMNCRWCWRRWRAQRGAALRRRPTRCCRIGRATMAATSRSSCPMPSARTRSLRDAPDWVADWTGFRPDSAPAIEGGERSSSGGRSAGAIPREKLLIFSDGLDVDMIEEAYHHFDGKVRMAFGWGTNLTNDFEGCSPEAEFAARSDLASCARCPKPTDASRGQALGQPRQGDRTGRRDRALSQGLR